MQWGILGLRLRREILCPTVSAQRDIGFSTRYWKQVKTLPLLLQLKKIISSLNLTLLCKDMPSDNVCKHLIKLLHSMWLFCATLLQDVDFMTKPSKWHRLVEHVTNSNIRERLLLESDITLDKAVKIATQVESAVQQAKTTAADDSVSVQLVQSRSQPSKKKNKPYTCSNEPNKSHCYILPQLLEMIHFTISIWKIRSN